MEGAGIRFVPRTPFEDPKNRLPDGETDTTEYAGSYFDLTYTLVYIE